MKSYSSINHRHAAIQFSSFAIAACALAIIMNSCQDYEYGFTEAEIHQEAISRQYDKEFHKAFPVVDPEHTWMCEPDTVRYGSSSLTRAGETPSMEGPSGTIEYTNAEITEALQYMDEGKDNRGKCAQSFEYVAFETQTYDIYPVFWGRKFCDNNTIGVYYVGADGKPVSLQPNSGFWSDQWNQITAVFADGKQKQISAGEYPINELQSKDGRNGGDWDKVVPLTKTCEADHSHVAWNNPCKACGSTYKYTRNQVGVNSFLLPHFTLTVPAGTKWGLYLTTKKQQTDNSEFVTWYSNANFNDHKEKAAATFHFNGKTYCSFEDAPHECTNTSGTGTCGTCGYGHYDTDFNDIVLYISPRPYETTYQSIKYRVMCEDLGGTFDWDFNDVVYDVIYQEDENLNKNATVSIILQAVGGTLPVSLYYDNEQCMNNGVAELHQILQNSQRPDDKGLYQPVNVSPYNHPLGNKVVKKIDLGVKRVPNMDIRDYVKHVTIRVQQDPKNSETTTEVTFPVAPKDNGGLIPQCFMTSTNTDWADELQPITEKYSHFEGWVMQQDSDANWWDEGLGGTEQNVVQK